MKKISFILFAGLAFFHSCSFDKPRAQGADNEIIIVCSNENKEEGLYILSNIFNDTLYTPQPELSFNQVWVTPNKFNEIKKNVNVVIISIGNDIDNPGTGLVKKLLSEDQFNSGFFGNNNLIFTKDVFARDQNMLIINGPNKDAISKTVIEKGPWVEKQFEALFVHRQSQYMLNTSSRQIELENNIKKKFNWSMKIPYGYTIISDSLSKDFFWVGREMPYRWLAVQWSEGLLFSDSSTASQYVKSLPLKYFKTIRYADYYFKIEPDLFNERGAWKVSGLWESIEEAQGGPFLSYLFYDENQDRTYFVHTMIFYPGKNKYLLLKQLDIIAKTFETF